jgi:hypothetical protein
LLCRYRVTSIHLLGSRIGYYAWSGFAGAQEFIGSSGWIAKFRLGAAWPANVGTSSVSQVSCKRAWSRDSYSVWSRIEISNDGAMEWMDHIHDEEERYSRECPRYLHEEPEGVHRLIEGPPPLHRQTDSTPNWWSPPEIEFRATEIMLWYKGYESGVGRATYSGFDQATQTLWVYEYACQHDELWSPGIIPRGTRIDMSIK